MSTKSIKSSSKMGKRIKGQPTKDVVPILVVKDTKRRDDDGEIDAKLAK